MLTIVVLILFLLQQNECNGFSTTRIGRKLTVTQGSSCVGSLSATSYRLWDEKGIVQLGPLAKPVGFVLNTVADLLRIQGEGSFYPPEIAKKALLPLLKSCQPNGLTATEEQKSEINSLVMTLEASNPTRDPAYSAKMDGFWRMLHTDFPPGPSSGKLGPFTGEVFQDLDSEKKVIKNILRVSFPPIVGALVADQVIVDRNTWGIQFDRISNSIGGVINLPTKKFPSTEPKRLWEITYLDNDLRVVRARREDLSKEDSYVFILVKDEQSRFDPKV